MEDPIFLQGGHPTAALFTFSVPAACFNMLSVLQAALGQVHGAGTIDDEASLYAMVDELGGTYRGMMIALPPSNWARFQSMTVRNLSHELSGWAQGVELRRYQKHRRGPKRRQQRAYEGTKHVSTARLLNAEPEPDQKPHLKKKPPKKPKPKKPK